MLSVACGASIAPQDFLSFADLEAFRTFCECVVDMRAAVPIKRISFHIDCMQDAMEACQIDI